MKWTVDPDGGEALTPTTVNGSKPIVQFQVGASLSVEADDAVTDGDISGGNKNVTGERLQWSRSASKTGTGTPIKDATEVAYTVTTDDIGMYIRVEAFYNVGTGREESASLTSDYPVLASRTSNDAPEFSPSAVTRSVAEGKKGMNVGAPVTATDDISNALNYVLSTEATSPDNAKFKIDQKTGQITTGVDLNRESAEATDDNDCEANFKCVVQVIATDSAGAASDPVATVTITLANVDEKPKFTSVAGTALSPKAIMSPENSTALFADGRGAGFVTEAVGVTYAATDPDGSNVTWSLMGADRAKFQLSGSRVLSFEAKPDYENPGDANRDNVYMVTVRASDGTLYADRMVAVTVTNEDDAPEITGKDSVNFPENSKDPVATFTAVDPEGVTPITWAFATSAQVDAESDLADADNADAGDFMIDKDGVLKFSSPPDFENAQGGTDNTNTYKVVVAACDVSLVSNACPDTGEAGYHKVTVKVTKVAETGKVTWTVDPAGPPTATVLDSDSTPIVQFQVDAVLTASVEDGDIAGATQDVTVANNNLVWRWYRDNTLIRDAQDDPVATNNYTVTTDDVGKRIRVVASYSVGSDREEPASLTSDYPVLASRTTNEKPEFDPAAITRSVSEGKKGMNVGARVTATDDITNALNYTLTDGADVAKFKIDQKTGQITTAQNLNREHTDADAAPNFGCGDNYKCVVQVTATDSAGAASDPATVTITLANVDEKPKFTSVAGTALSPKTIKSPEENTALFADGRDADEGFVTTEAGVTYAATDEDDLNVNLTLMGPDAAKFGLSSSGVLSFKAKPDYENPGDANRDNVYMVTVRASDGTLYADQMVSVTVTEVDEAPEITRGGLSISGRSSVSHPEGSPTSTAVGTYTARGENPAGARWTLEGDDRGDFRLSTTSGASVMLMFRSSPDYESPADAGTDNVYMVTLKATEGTNTDTHEVTVRVTEVVEDVPVVGGTLLDTYDADDSGKIERGEVITAINDYLDAGAGAPSRADVITVINLYLDS